MPFIQHSSFPGSPFWQRGGHLQTIVPGLFRRTKGVDYQRERIETPDNDFLDLDWLRSDANRKLVVITHGLEGNSGAQYALGTAKLFAQNAWDVLAWNCRSCSGEMNRQFRMYHHGDTVDIDTVIQHALAGGQYDTLVLVGFSMGGNISLKYLGTQGENVPKQVKAAAVFSAPCDIRAGADVLDRWDNVLYKYQFMLSIYQKIKVKAAHYPGTLDLSKFKKVRYWRDFDEFFSAPISGYASAAEFHQQASAKNFLEGIRVPALLVSAQNDPILTEQCFPIELAKAHPFFHLELPEEGGHCGFQTTKNKEFSWSERRALEFCSNMGI
jgi:predicted alpha/beta-fold hydrolase